MAATLTAWLNTVPQAILVHRYFRRLTIIEEHMRTARLAAAIVFALSGLLTVAGAVRADEYWRRDDIRRFHEHDQRIWHSGRWIHGRHDGRFGWWWVVGEYWYFYPAPSYPYPEPLIPQVVAPSPPPMPEPTPMPAPAPAY